jgi:hypothetical protein
VITLRITSWKISEAEDITKLRRLYRNKPACVLKGTEQEAAFEKIKQELSSETVMTYFIPKLDIGTEQEAAFEKLKQELSSKTVMTYFIPKLKWLVISYHVYILRTSNVHVKMFTCPNNGKCFSLSLVDNVPTWK